jgi:hypothetical protein
MTRFRSGHTLSPAPGTRYVGFLEAANVRNCASKTYGDRLASRTKMMPTPAMEAAPAFLRPS